MEKLVVYSEKCIACGKCYLNYPDVFDCDDTGIAFVLPKSTHMETQQAKRAVYECPTKAIQIIQQPDKS